MPSFKKTHEDFWQVICGVCWRKPKNLQIISPAVLSMIQSHCYKEYDLENRALPLSACKPCVAVLRTIDKVILDSFIIIT